MKQSFFNRQFNRISRFLKILPLAIQSLGVRGVAKKLTHQFLFHGVHGLKIFVREYSRQRRVLQLSPLKENKKETSVMVEQFNKLDEAERFSFTLRLSAQFPHSFASLDKKGYLIVAPDYVSNSAGIYCLYKLCNDLNRKGFPSFMALTGRTHPDLVAPIISLEAAHVLLEYGFTAIYPESIPGNHLNAKKIARWVLNRPGLIGGGDKIYNPEEKVFYYSEVFKRYIQNKISGKLYMPTIDETIFYPPKDENKDRTLTCYYVGKSQFQEGYFDKNETFEITRSTPPKKELGKLLRASKVLYCFDNSTILAYEAVLCGCPVVIIPDGTQTWEDYQSLELGMDGLAWGIEDLPNALPNLKRFIQRYETIKQDYHRQLDEFITITQANESNYFLKINGSRDSLINHSQGLLNAKTVM